MSQFGVTRDVLTGNAVHSVGVAPSTPKQRTGADSNNALTIIGTITSQVVLITALFYYFGWVYTRSYFNYFGIHASLAWSGTALRTTCCAVSTWRSARVST